MPEPAFLHSIVELHWGFTVRQLGASAAQLAYPLPPPPSVVGAFANPLARLLGLGEEVDPRRGPAAGRVMECALRATIAAGAGLEPSGPRGVGVVVYAEPSRIAAALYKTGGDYSNAIRQPPYLAADRLLPVQAAGSASAPGARLALAWLVDVEKLSSCLQARVGLAELGEAAWWVYRVGSREGLAAALEAGVAGPGEVEVVEEGGVFESILYQPARCARPAPGSQVVRVNLYGRTYREEAYLAPTPAGGPSGLAPPPSPAGYVLTSTCRAARPRGRGTLSLSFESRLWG
ncbi:MAG: hypothetical protein LRS49_03705 [Desulfurococcales archaeon]|nr:hypothetical protein [Desulfurococcales archaeon]